MPKKDVNNNGNGNSFNYGTSHVYDDPHSTANQPLDSVRKVDPMPNGAEQNHGSNYCSPGKAWHRFWKCGFKGCASRSEFWWSHLLVGLFLSGCKLLDLIIILLVEMSLSKAAPSSEAGDISIALILPLLLLSLWIFIKDLMLYDRRCHDIGWPGWCWIFLAILTIAAIIKPFIFIGAIALGLWITLAPSKLQGNHYRI